MEAAQVPPIVSSSLSPVRVAVLESVGHSSVGIEVMDRLPVAMTRILVVLGLHPAYLDIPEVVYEPGCFACAVETHRQHFKNLTENHNGLFIVARKDLAITALGLLMLETNVNIMAVKRYELLVPPYLILAS